MRTRAASPLLAVCASLYVAASSVAWAEPNPYLADGLRLQQEMEHAQAVEALRRALAWGPSTPEERAKIHVHLAISQCNLLEWNAAEASFRSALAEDLSVELPGLTSPRITSLFERLRTEEQHRRLQRRVASRPASGPLSSPTSNPASLSAPVPGPARPAAEVARPRPWPVWAAVAFTGASLGSAAVLAVLSRQAEQDADDRTLPWSRAMARYDQARSRAIAADVLFGVGGAAAIVSAILLYRAYRARPPAHERRISVLPLPTGVLLGSGGSW